MLARQSRNHNLFGDIDVENIVPYGSERAMIEGVIEDELEKAFPRTLRGEVPIGEIEQELFKHYPDRLDIQAEMERLIVRPILFRRLRELYEEAEQKSRLPHQTFLRLFDEAFPKASKSIDRYGDLKNFWRDEFWQDARTWEAVKEDLHDEIEKARMEYLGDYSPFSHDKLGRAKELYYIGSFLKRSQLDVERPIDDLRDVLRGKKILVLGDDTGSMSETLNHFGADACGIEYSSLKVAIAHTGVLAEDRAPQQQVILGDIVNLADQQSALYKMIATKGPFDVICSDAVFNIGSGLETSIRRQYKGPTRQGDFICDFDHNIRILMQDDGFQLHLSVDWDEAFGPYHSYGHGRNDARGTDVDSRTVLIPKKSPPASNQ